MSLGMVHLSCGCWFLTPAEVTRQAGYSAGPIVCGRTCGRCMALRLADIENRMKPETSEQLDFLELVADPPTSRAEGASFLS